MVDTRVRELPEGLDGWPPGEDDLPYSDGMPMETHQHVLNSVLLTEPLWRVWMPRSGRDAFIGANMFVYFSPDQVLTEDFRGPDVFVVLDPRRRSRPRKSWVVWHEDGKAPNVVIELMSDTTMEKDKQEKLLVYQNRLRVPEYILFHPLTGELLGYRLVNGVYERITPDEQGRLACDQLGLLLALWQGKYADTENTWLRWGWPDGSLLPLPEEAAAAAFRRAEAERQRADAAQERADRLDQQARDLARQLEQYRQRFGDLPDV